MAQQNIAFDSQTYTMEKTGEDSASAAEASTTEASCTEVPETEEKLPLVIWVIEASGPDSQDLLSRACKLLEETEGITVIDEPGYFNGLLFKKDDSVPLPIDPKEEHWGYTVNGEEVMKIEVVQKNEKKKRKYPKKAPKKKERAISQEQELP